MSIRFRKSMKLVPGVRLNFSKNTVGMSFGVPGARYTINSKGRRTFSTGIPGTGLYNVQTLSSGKRSRTSAASRDTTSAENSQDNHNPYSGPPAPGLFASSAERELNKFLLDIYDSESPDDPSSVISKAAALRGKYDELKDPLELIAFLHGITDDKWEKQAREWGESLWKNRERVFSDKYVTKYFKGITPAVTISAGITTKLYYNMQTLGFIWVEILQGQKKFDEAVAVLNEMEPDQMVGISLADIEISKGDFDGAIETTSEIDVTDDATAMMMLLRGVAFRGKNMQEAAIECFKRALKIQKSLPEALVHRVLFERSESYALMGKKAMAIKDLEKILVDDPSYPEVEKRLAELKG
jgi:tetratricopeptide (TPR) repeat protein